MQSTVRQVELRISERRDSFPQEPEKPAERGEGDLYNTTFYQTLRSILLVTFGGATIAAT